MYLFQPKFCGKLETLESLRQRAVVVDTYIDSGYQQKDGGGVNAKPFQAKISI
jgi:hypothetical protein